MYGDRTLELGEFSPLAADHDNISYINARIADSTNEKNEYWTFKISTQRQKQREALGFKEYICRSKFWSLVY